MSKHHLKNIAEQIAHTGHGSSPFHYGKECKDSQTKPTADEGSIQLRAYQIHQEKGGSDLDNWLEAEKSLSIKS